MNRCGSNTFFSLYVIGLFLLTAFFSCVGIAPTREVRYIDSLNHVAYSFRYKNLDSSFHAASMAYADVNLYRQGKAEATNNLAFCAFMHMNFDVAERLHKEVYTLTQNELELLIADVGLMKIFQRTVMNKEFFDYRNSALQRMKRIDEERDMFMEGHEKARLNYAFTEFFIVSAVYYYYLQQRTDALYSIGQIAPEEELERDPGQLLYYHYIKGACSLIEGNTPDERKLREFDELYYTWRIAAQEGYTYFEGNGIQGLANLMASPENYAFFLSRRSHALSQLGVPVDSLLPLRLGQEALRKFKEYDDIYQIAGAYVSIGKYLNAHGSYQEALDTLEKALDCVNFHHQLYYTHSHDSLDILRPYEAKDTIYTEVQWIENQVKTVPEWISRIREQLSVSYAGLEKKAKSDYNRNVYLDILDYTRQDKEWESRSQALEAESRKLSLLLFAVVAGIILTILLFWIFNNRSHIRSRRHMVRLRQTLEVCQKVIASVPADLADEQEIVRAVNETIFPEMRELFGVQGIEIRLCDEETGEFVCDRETADDHEEKENVEEREEKVVLPKSGAESDFLLTIPDKEFPVGSVKLYTRYKLTKEEMTLVQVITPYIAWAIDNGIKIISLGEEREQLDKQRYVFEQHIATNKRQNVVKKACMAIVNGINPYMDRIINEVRKLKEKGFTQDPEIRKEKFRYIEELVTTINEYNDILAMWIKMKQGTLSLNIENFELNDLFQLVSKGRRTFKMKQQHFEVAPTDAVVKADKALTLFMINTLTENARKYTPPGGTVRVYADVTEEYVEISVTDNGRGLSREDIEKILGEKVYDSKEIGMSDTNYREELLRNKGSGFGLMNCKGIIEKYRKTNEIFRVCTFDIESRPGQGSRFYFRLPPGVRKFVGALLLLVLPWALNSCGLSPRQKNGNQMPEIIFADVYSEDYYEELLNRASRYADTAYYCNVIEEYERAVHYVDSAIHQLNIHYLTYCDVPDRLMTLRGEGIAAELKWWEQLFDSDFHVILDIRNEAAVAFLALKDWDAYAYNNVAYTTLYKLLGEDNSIEAYCLELERSTTNKMVGILWCVVLFIASLSGYYVLYIRKRFINRFHLEQVLEINQQVFTASLIRTEDTEDALQREEEVLKEIPRHIVTEAFEEVNELLNIGLWGIAVYNENTGKLEYASDPPVEEMPDLIQKCFDKEQVVAEKNRQALPLLIDTGGNHRCVGVLYLERIRLSGQDTDPLYVELIARYVAVVIFNAVIKIATKYRDIDSAQDEVRRASWEDSLLHVQNMVLDNCLSTIKHETIYYPNKIKQIIRKLNAGGSTEKEEVEHIDTIAELIEYYKGIFLILSSCASRQLEEVTFRRSVVAVEDLFTYAQRYLKRAARHRKERISLICVPPGNERVVGDVILLCFLLENLIDEALSNPQGGELILRSRADGEYIRFDFVDTRRERSVEELNRLFYPELARMTQGEKGELQGTECLVCKQIIRDHDEFAGRRGCRINAEPAPEGGYSVYFTIPKR